MSKTELPTQDMLFMVVCLWLKLESSSLYFWEDMSIKTLILLVSPVIFKCFVAAALWGPVVLRCDEMLSLAGFKGGTDRGSETRWSRAVPGHTQQAHTREFYKLCQPRGLLYTALCGRLGRIFLLKKKEVVPNETQIPATH